MLLLEKVKLARGYFLYFYENMCKRKISCQHAHPFSVGEKMAFRHGTCQTVVDIVTFLPPGTGSHHLG